MDISVTESNLELGDDPVLKDSMEFYRCTQPEPSNTPPTSWLPLLYVHTKATHTKGKSRTFRVKHPKHVSTRWGSHNSLYEYYLPGNVVSPGCADPPCTGLPASPSSSSYASATGHMWSVRLLLKCWTSPTTVVQDPNETVNKYKRIRLKTKILLALQNVPVHFLNNLLTID